MKNVCKICLSVCLILAMLVGTTCTPLLSSAASIRDVPTDAYEGYYPDIKIASWYFDAASYVTYYEVMSGYQNGYFGPSDNLQRQDFVLILSRAAKADLSRYQNQNGGMRDVKSGSYYAPAVAWAVDNGIITGYQNGNFGVGDTVTREQVCTIFYRYYNSPAVNNADATLSAFPDKKHISAFAYDAMAWAVQNGVISGMQNGKIAPVSGASRAQIATIAMRMELTATNNPKAPTKPTVVDAYSSGSGYSRIAIPRIVLSFPSERIASINEIIWRNMYTDFVLEYADMRDSLYITAGYSYALNDNILSLVAYTNIENSTTYYVYNIDTTTGALFPSQAIAAAGGVAKSNYTSYTRRVLGSYYYNMYSSVISPSSPVYNEFMQQYNRTVSSNNISAATYYLNEDKELCVVARIYSLAGADSYWRDINTTEVTLRNNLP